MANFANIRKRDDSSSERSPERPDAERSRASLFLDQQEKRCPRTFNIIFYVTVPLIILICLCMFCGHFLAVLEKDNELKTNDAFIAYHVREAKSFDEAIGAQQQVYDDCLDMFIDTNAEPTMDVTELKTFMAKCTEDVNSKTEEWKTRLKATREKELIDNILTFDWNTCSENGMPASHENQGHYSYNRWVESKKMIYAEHIKSEEIEDSEALELAIDNATSGDFCRTNSAGGAMFWFTIMTTIGYGNTAPVTGGGRMFVMLLGFISILAFGAVSGAAGYVSLIITDDFFKRCNMTKMIKGWGAVLFWLCLLLLSLLAVALISGLYMDIRGNPRPPLADLYWFAFNSITTIGLGDISVPHETFRQVDMFYIPLLMLFGFVAFTNFLIKIADKLNDIAESTGLTDDESLGFLLEKTLQVKPPGEVEVHNKEGEDNDDMDSDNFDSDIGSKGPNHEFDLSAESARINLAFPRTTAKSTEMTEAESLGNLVHRDRSQKGGSGGSHTINVGAKRPQHEFNTSTESSGNISISLPPILNNKRIRNDRSWGSHNDVNDVEANFKAGENRNIDSVGDTKKPQHEINTGAKSAGDTFTSNPPDRGSPETAILSTTIKLHAVNIKKNNIDEKRNRTKNMTNEVKPSVTFIGSFFQRSGTSSFQ